MTESHDYRARGVLHADGSIQDGAAVRVVDGRVREVLSQAPTGATDLGDVLLTPPLVNAHCHLELSGFGGRLPRDRGFGAWVRELMTLRAAATPDELESAARAGAQRLWETGCALVHDIDTTGAAARALTHEPIDVVLYREAIDAGDATRRAACLAELERALPGYGSHDARREGISPHAPFTCSPELLRELASLARRRNLPITMHWAETEEEVRYLRDGTGPLAEILPPSPKCSGLELIEAAGLLAGDLELTLVHGNYPEPGDYERLAAAGVALVHCPGTHAFFDRSPFDVRAVLGAGVVLRLGTDSLASNEDLDLSAELRNLLEQGDLSIQEAWGAATAGAGMLDSRHLALWDYTSEDANFEGILRAGRIPRILG